MGCNQKPLHVTTDQIMCRGMKLCNIQYTFQSYKMEKKDRNVVSRMIKKRVSASVFIGIGEYDHTCEKK